MTDRLVFYPDPEQYTGSHDIIVDIAAEDPLFDIDRGLVLFDDKLRLADYTAAPGNPEVRGISNAFTEIQYTSPFGEVVQAELFTNDYASAQGRSFFEIYPLDSHDSPFGVTLTLEVINHFATDEELYKSVCAAALYGYTQRRSNNC